jgi:hypothetical protein
MIMEVRHGALPSSRPVRLAYQPPTNNTFLSEQISQQQPASSIFLSEQISTSHQQPAKRTGCLELSLHSTCTYKYNVKYVS